MAPIVSALNTDVEIRKLVDMLTQLRADVDVLMASSRVNQLNYSSINDTALPIYGTSSEGIAELKARLGKQPDGTYAITYHNGDAPPNPVNIGVAERQLGILVTWDGTFAGNATKPANFLRLDVYIDTAPGFVPSVHNLMGSLFSESALFIGADVRTHYVKVATVNTSDVASFPSFEIAVTPLPAAELAAGSVKTITLDADIVWTRNIVIGNTNSSHITFNPVEGGKFYGTNGTTVLVEFDINTGQAKFTGDIATSTGTDKVVIGNSSGDPEIALFRVEAGGNKAYITGVGQTSDSTIDLVLHGGPDLPFTPDREYRMGLGPDSAEIMYADRPAGSIRGPHFILSRNTAALRMKHDNGTGATNGGNLDMSNISLNQAVTIGGTDRSTLLLQDGFATLSARNTGGGVRSQVALKGSGDTEIYAFNILKLFGRFENLIGNTVDSNEALLVGEVFINGPNGGFANISYGTTMDSILLPIVTLDGSLRQWTVTNNTVTGFRVQWSGTDSCWLRFACFRI